MSNYLGCCAILICIVAGTGCVSYEGEPVEVVFKGSGGTELRGTLVFPKNANTPVPAAILLHGSEKATRSFAYRMHANVFLERGIAVLLYDKRGAGKSGGNYEQTTYAQLVGDAIEAVTFLRQRKDIDASKIGLVGASESGWLTPEVTERVGDIAFVINKSGPALSWRETVAWDIYNELLAADVSEPDARAQIELQQRVWAYYLSPNAEERGILDEALASWAGREDSLLPTAMTEVSDAYIEKISYDPSPYLERLSTPMLYVYGAHDVNVPVEKCLERLSKLAAEGTPVSFHTSEEAGHELGSVGVFPPGYRCTNGYSGLLGNFAEKHSGLLQNAAR